jgi:hypothetical protein
MWSTWSTWLATRPLGHRATAAPWAGLAQRVVGRPGGTKPAPPTGASSCPARRRALPRVVHFGQAPRLALPHLLHTLGGFVGMVAPLVIVGCAVTRPGKSDRLNPHPAAKWSPRSADRGGGVVLSFSLRMRRIAPTPGLQEQQSAEQVLTGPTDRLIVLVGRSGDSFLTGAAVHQTDSTQGAAGAQSKEPEF